MMDFAPDRDKRPCDGDDNDDLTALTYDHGFDEDKCRNVLVRYCAHIPRNYQYRDGVQLVFLVLRDHLGDEHLGRAGGVLYEMIELDCHHSDDPGAAFQRWRHDHMHRHANLELPHIPHLTTVSTNITPTAALVKWRAEHPQRYQIRLSDHSPHMGRSSSLPGCIRHRKSWTIDYTTYVSSRDGGTWPMRRLDPKEFHEMHWNPEHSHRGRLVEERSLDLSEISALSIRDESSTRPLQQDEQPSPFRTTSTRPRSLSEVVIRAYGKIKSHSKRTSSTGLAMVAGLQSMHRDASLCNLLEPRHHAEVHEWDIPNASFARKFGLLADGHSLPPSIKELPVAEDKAVDNAVYNVEGLSVQDVRLSLGFQGPFTPQLWFDGGLDYRYKRE